MTKLSKPDLKLKELHTEMLRESYDKLDAAVSAFNAAVEEAWENVQAALDEHNQAIAEAEDWRAGIVERMESYYDERSDKWQESDKGQEYDAWKQEWSESFEQVEMDRPDEPDFDVEDYAAIISDNFREELEG